MPLNAYEAGFQNNTTIDAAFWIYKPDFNFDPKGKEVMVNVNLIQHLEVDPPVIRMPQITNIAISGGVVTVTGTNSFQPYFNAAIINGLQNATFLNGLILPVSNATTQQFTATMPTLQAPVTNVMVASDVLTITARQIWPVGLTVTFSGLVNATFLNGQTVTITSVSQNFSDPSGYATFTANFTYANYGTGGCGAGNDIGTATLNTNGWNMADSGAVYDPKERKVWLYYAESAVSPSQRPLILEGIAAQAFINDMEALFS
jgi:hypothetical protein